MPFSLIPDRLFDAYDQITPELLRGYGVTLLLSDLDFTLAEKKTRRPPQALRDWLDRMEAGGIEVMIVSNNRSGRRVDEFCAELGIAYQGHAGKPSTRGLEAAMARAGADRAHTAMLGDLWTTDILGARLWGLTMLAVEPVEGAPNFGHWLLYQMHRPFMAAVRRRQRKQ